MQKSLFDKIVAALKPEMSDEHARRATVEAALYGCSVLGKIKWTGAEGAFTKRLVTDLDQFGEIEQGRLAVVALLEEVREQVGAERQRQIGELLAELRLRELEAEYLERLRSELQHPERYTPLRGALRQARVEMRAVFEHKPRPFELMSLGKEHSAQQEPRQCENAVDEIGRIRRAVLLGEPGGGKTTTLWKLAVDLIEKAQHDPKAPIPFLIPLGQWTDADQPLAGFLVSQLGELAECLELLLVQDRAALLLDGLNELRAGQREVKYPQVRQLIEQYPRLLTIVSCREDDYTVDLGFDRITITPLDPLRIREFVIRYLEAEKGDALFWKLAGPAAKDSHQEFMEALGRKLPDPDRVFWMDSQLPEEAAEARWGWSKESDWRWQNWIRDREHPASLMVLARNPFMLLMLTSVYDSTGELPENRGELFRLFVERLLNREEIPADQQPTLTDGLAAVAYAMQIRRADDESGDALTALPKEEVSATLSEQQLYWARSASILSVGEQVHFTHQLLQEYFAARYMDREFRAGRLKATEIWPPEKWWERTNWEEAAILLAGIYSNDCSRIVEWVAEANPEVAAMCAVRSGANLAQATKEKLRSQWIPRLTDLERDPEPDARASVGRALAMMALDDRKGVGIFTDQRGIVLPDIDWVEIPAGEFQYGDESIYAAAKPQKLTLPTFHIGRYPVTYSQFQTFLDDPEGFSDPRWFEGVGAGDDERRMDEQSLKFANHPRENVSWYQAIAFCRWFSWRLGGGYDLKKIADWAVRLPTEFEWEKAARGIAGRIYPYEGEYDAAKGNTKLIGPTSAVGIYPNGASPYGVMDMSGNVWEWCLSNFEKPSFAIQKENLKTDKDRVLRGGSWFGDRDRARAVVRHYGPPAGRDNGLGFRLVLFVCPPSL